MDLPEIRQLVAQCLGGSDLVACMGVSKSWNHSFTPALWSVLEWGFASSSPSQDLIRMHAHHVRTLILGSLEGETASLADCTRLAVLDLTLEVPTENHWAELEAWIRHNPQLRQVCLQTRGVPPSIDFIQALVNCPGMKEFSTSFCDFNGQQSALLLELCSRLEGFSAIGTGMSFPGSTEGWHFPEMRNLRLSIHSGLTIRQQLEFIQECPKLESLAWSVEEGFPTLDFVRLLPTRCQLLRAFDLDYEAFTDAELAMILDTSSRVTKFMVWDTQFGPLAFQSLNRHLGHLTGLNLVRCHTTSRMCQQLLSSCPNLTEFYGGPLLAQEVVEGQDWVCLNMRSLSLYICGLLDKPSHVQGTVWQQLARLVKLRSLNIGTQLPEMERSRDGLTLRLQSGMGALGGLRQLESFCFDGLDQEMDEADVQWMVDTWPEIERVEGKVHVSTRRRLELEHILAEKHIALVGHFDSDEEDGVVEPDDDDDDDDDDAEGA